MTESQRDLVLHLLGEGDWQDAVKAYAEEMGVSPEEADDAVKQLAIVHAIAPPRGRRWIMIAAIASMLSLVAGWAIAQPF